MTLYEAMAALVYEYELEQYVDLIRDEVKGDPEFNGLSQDHPKVKRFQEACETLRSELKNRDFSEAFTRAFLR